MKKGQVTIFIIIGMIIVATFAILYVNKSKLSGFDMSNDDYTESKNNKEMIKNYVEYCLEDLGTAGLYFIGNTGGHIFFNENVHLTMNEITSYATNFNENNNNNPLLNEYQDTYGELYNEDISPKKEFMINEINKFIENTVLLCIDEGGFENLELIFGEVNADTYFGWFDVSIKLDFPIIINDKGKEISVNGYKVDLPFRMNKIIGIRDKIIELVLTNDVNYDNLGKLGLKITILPYDGQTIIYIITDEKSGVNGKSYNFKFATKTKYNTNPKLDFIPNFKVKENELFTYQTYAIDSEDNLLNYTSTSSLVHINDEGLITLMPIGLKKINTTICAIDSDNAKDCEEVRFEIIQ